MSPLRKRILSGIVMLILALLGLFSGREAFELMLALCGAVLAWEWTRLVGEGRFGVTGLAIAFVVLAAGALATDERIALAILVCFAGAIGVFLVAEGGKRGHPRWLAAGPVYIGLPIVALIWLRGYDLAGLETILWLMACVWATDTGAFFAGRGIGGPKLAPALSPNKTWAGLIGGMTCAALVAPFASWLAPTGPAGWPLALAGMVIAVVAQGGDLLESFVKRHFGVKDSGKLIPGHGGLFDRVDGVLPVALLLGALAYLGQLGVGTAG